MDEAEVSRLVRGAVEGADPLDETVVTRSAQALMHRFEPVSMDELDTPIDLRHVSRVCLRRGKFSYFFDLTVE